MTGPGTWRGLARLADDAGTFRMLALDQRPPVHQLVASRLGVDAAPAADVLALKQALLGGLAPQASAVLLDPLTALASIDCVGPRRGLILTLEDSVFEDTAGGRRSRVIEGWSVDRIKRMGGDAVKMLAWFRPDADPAVIAHQDALVTAAGEACRRCDLPFVFELLLYPFADGTNRPVPRGEERADLVVRSLEHFADDRFGVDVFKVESPYAADELPGLGDDASYLAAFLAIDETVQRPWVLLSGGADRPAFVRALEHAYAAGASGYLAGRSIWWDAATEFPDLARVRTAVASDAVAFMADVDRLTIATAAPWTTRIRPGAGWVPADVVGPIAYEPMFDASLAIGGRAP